MPLQSMPAMYWNRIAREQNLESKWAKEVFALDDQELLDRVDQEWRELQEQGVDERVASAFVDFKPHLLERKALLKFRRDNPDLMLDQALPEINEPEEALYLAQVEFMLDNNQLESLLQMFQELTGVAEIKAQQDADNIAVIPNDRASIAETLPALFGGWQDDVKLAEDGFSVPDQAVGLDWTVYEQAKPHFVKAWEEFSAAGKSLREFAAFIIKNLSEKVRPYLKHFLQEVQAGRLYDQTKEQALATTQSDVLEQDRQNHSSKLIDSSVTTSSIFLDRGLLAQELIHLASIVRPLKYDYVDLWFADDHLQITYQGGDIAIPCIGTWRERIRFPLICLTSFANLLPKIDPFPVSLKKNIITFGVTHFTCTIIKSDCRYIQLSMRPKLKELIGLNYKFSLDEIQHSGLLEKYNKSKAIKEKILKKTYRLLRALDIHHDEVSKFIDGCIKRNNT
jgi:hypothetical protein